MGFFTRHEEKPQVEEELSLADRVTDAAQRVRAADEQASAAGKRLYDFQIEHNLSLDRFGNITRCSVIGGTTEADLAQQVRALVVARTLALQDFHDALRVHAGLKLAASQEVCPG